MNRPLATFAFVFAGIGLAAAASAETPLKPVKLMEVSTNTPRLERKFYGQVTARRSVDLAFQVPGQIVDFPVVEGNVVPKGDRIAQLDLEPFELQLEQARLQREQADRTVARLHKLEGTVSQVSIDDAETQAGLTRIALRNAEYELEHATLSAPFDALVSHRNVELFTTVAAGTPIVRLHDMSQLHIEIDVPEILFQRADQDPSTQIYAEFPARTGWFPLRVLEFDAEASSVGQTYRVTFAMTPPEDFNVLPGASATVTVSADFGTAGIEVPPSALVIDPQGRTGVVSFAPAGADEGTVAWTEVTVEPTEQGGFLVTDGLEDGQEIVITGGAALETGQAVRRFTGFAN
jgi:RND family efflux transporter MFP subunit